MGLKNKKIFKNEDVILQGENPGEAIDTMEKTLRDKYLDGLSRIKSLPGETPEELDIQRQAVIQWIQDEENKVKVVIAFSGGKDSVAMVLHALYDLKIPKERIELWHHDIDGHGEALFDWACTPSYCRAFAEAFGLRLITSYRSGGILREMYRQNEPGQDIYYQQEPDGEYLQLKSRGWDSDKNTRLKFPAVEADLMKRWCSAVAKIDVMSKVVNNWSKYDNCNMVIMTGERRQESNKRKGYKEVEKSRNEGKTRRALQWRPIIDWMETDVWAIIEKYKVQPHPCYELGWGRCSCQLCIFSKANTWASINEISPEKVFRIAQIEQDLKEKSEALVEAETANPALIKMKKDDNGNLFPSPHVSMPYLYGDDVKEEALIPAKTVEKDGKVRRYKERVGMVKTGKKMSIYEARVDNGISFITETNKERWLAEANGEFVSPIFVEKWIQPQGAYSTEENGAV